MANSERHASIELPKTVIDEIAEKLNIRDVSRIPHRLVVTSVAEEAASHLQIQKPAVPVHVLVQP